MELQHTISTAYDTFKKGDYARTWDVCQQVLQLNPEQPDCFAMLGIMCNKATRYTQAEKYLCQCLPSYPQPNVILTELAISLIGQGRYSEAEACIAKSYKHNNRYTKTYIQHAKLLKLQNKYTVAEQVLRKLLTIDPDSHSALNNLGSVLIALNKPTEALEMFREALTIKPHGATYKNIGLIELANNNKKAALQNFAFAYTFLPNDTSLLLEIGKIYFHSQKREKAISVFAQLLKIDAQHVQALMYTGIAYNALRQYEKAAPLFEQVLEQDEHYTEAFYELARCKNNLADWTNWNATRDKLIGCVQKEVQSDRPASASAFDVHYYNLPDVLQFQLMHAIKKRYDTVAANQFSFEGRKHEKIRIGYMSPDFRAHAVGMYVYQLFAQHNREEFEVYTFSVYTPDTNDTFYKSIVTDADHAFDVSALTAQATAQLIHDNEIDILVDFGGYTSHTKPEVLAMKPAPLQILMYGQPDTTALPQVDYFVADKTIIDEVNRKHYTENIVYLPHGFCSSIPASTKTITRHSQRIGDDAFIFCSFCSPYKYNPEMFEVWMKLLNSVDNSILWLLSNGNSVFEQNIYNEALLRGVDPKQILFAPHVSFPDHLNRMQLCDLFLDTQYYASCTTASHALMMGLPVLTIKGESIAKRQGASVCCASGLSDLVCNSLEEYFEKALELAQSPDKLQAIKNHLKKNREEIAHFDVPLNVGYIEQAYSTIWQKHRNGEACSDITIHKKQQ